MSQVEPRADEGEGRATQSSIDARVYRCFLFTDIEGSTALWEKYGQDFRAAIELHHSTVRSAIARFGGRELVEAGDGFLISFETPQTAVECATAMQEILQNLQYPLIQDPLRVRMGVHAGDVEPRENGEYRGTVLNRASRVRDAAHGGQIVCSEEIAKVLEGELECRELGRFRMKGLPSPERLYQVAWPGMLDEAFPTPNARPAFVHNLPTFSTSFVGRRREIREISQLLMKGAGSRLVTLTGPGGTGKTRIAVAIGESLLDTFSHAVFFVQFADIQDAVAIPREILQALQLTPDSTREPEQQVAAFFEGESALLILDNFEQLAETGSHSLQRLTAAAPKLRLLITSRNRVNLLGEREYPIPPLAIPATDATIDELREIESIQLFVQRAQLARAAFEFHDRNAQSVAELSRRLEGVPLAIELAAARSDVASPQEILASLSTRLDSLESMSDTTPARHRSLRAAIDWSFSFLPPALKDFFTALSVFRGGWTAEGAEAVAATPALGDVSANILRALSELRSASLISSEESGETMRFRMLETLRQFAEEKFASRSDRGRIQEAFRHYFLTFAETYGISETILGPEQAKYLAMFDAEFDNFRVLLGHRVDDESGIRMVSRVGTYCRIRGYFLEARDLINSQMPPPSDAGLLEKVDFFNTAASIEQALWDLSSARKHFEEALGIAREMQNPKLVASMLANVGLAAMREKAWDEAEACLKEGVDIFEQFADDPYRLAVIRTNLAALYLERRMPEPAAWQLDRIEIPVADVWDPDFLNQILAHRANVERLRGDLGRALRLNEEVVSKTIKIGNAQHLTYTLDSIAECYAAMCDTRNATKYLSASEYCAAKLAISGFSLEPDRVALREKLESQLSATEFVDLRRDGENFGAQLIKGCLKLR